MGVYGKAQTVAFQVWDAANETGKTGLTDAELTITLIRDGVAAAATGAITELSNGFYSLAISATEAEAIDMVLMGTCSVADCHVQPRDWQNETGQGLLEAAWADHDADDTSVAWLLGTLLKKALGPARFSDTVISVFEDALDGTTRASSTVSRDGSTTELTQD